MCVDPGTALAIGSTVASVAGSVTEHSRQAAVARDTETATAEALKFAFSDISARGREEIASATVRREQGRRVAQRAAATARAAAGESGVGGQSLDLLLGDVDRQFGEFADSVDANLETTFDQLNRARRGAVVQAKSRLNSIDRPSLFSTGLKIGSAGLQLGRTLIGRKEPLGA